MDKTVTFGPEVAQFLDEYRKPVDEYDNITITLFRDLTREEEQSFREWARNNLSEDFPPDSIHHPVIHDEWERMQRGEPMGTSGSQG